MVKQVFIVKPCEMEILFIYNHYNTVVHSYGVQLLTENKHTKGYKICIYTTIRLRILLTFPHNTPIKTTPKPISVYT